MKFGQKAVIGRAMSEPVCGFARKQASASDKTWVMRATDGRGYVDGLSTIESSLPFYDPEPKHDRAPYPAWSKTTRNMTAQTATSTDAVLRADAVEFLRGLASASVDLIVTDPAYESLEKHRAVGTTTRLKHSKSSSNDWFSIFPNARFPEFFREAFRVLKKNTHLYLFCDQETMFVAKPAGEEAGFKFWKPIVWDKRQIGMGYHYRSRYELILFFEKGKRKLASLSVPDILEEPRIRGGYPSEKPVRVSQILITQSSDLGALVVDPFCGSGSVGVAARSEGRRFTGCDICQEAVDVTRERLLAFPGEAL